MYQYEEEEEESDEEEKLSTSFLPSYALICIDTHPNMFKQNADGSVPFCSTLNAIYQIAESLILNKDSRSWRPFAVVFAGEENPLTDFSTNIVDAIKILKGKVNNSISDLRSQHERKSNIDLAGLFLFVKKLFNKITTPAYQRNFIYISNDDNPVTDDQFKNAALQEIKLLNNASITFNLIPTIPDFNYNLFYNELFSVINQLCYEDICMDTEGIIQKLSYKILVKVYEAKIKFYPFKGEDSYFIDCKRVNIYNPPRYINTRFTKTGEKVVNRRVTGEETGLDYPYIIKYKSERLNITLDERNSILDLSLPKGIHLIHVANRQFSPGHTFHGKPKLIKQDNANSNEFFKKFWEKCVNEDKVLICIIKIKQPARLRYVELIPMMINSEMMFLEKYLPYGNEVCYPFKKVYPEEEEVDRKRKNAIDVLVDECSFDFDAKMLINIPLTNKREYIKSKLIGSNYEKITELKLQKNIQNSVEIALPLIENCFSIGVNPKKKRKPRNATCPPYKKVK